MKQLSVGLPGRLKSIPIVLLVLAMLYILTKRRDPAEVFILGLIAVLLVYFGYATRLVLPVYTLILAVVVECLRDLLVALFGKRADGMVPAAALVLLISADFDLTRYWPDIEARYDKHLAKCETVRQNVGPNSRLATTTAWDYNVCLGKSVYGLAHTFRRSGDPASVERIIEEIGHTSCVLARRPSMGRYVNPLRASRRASVAPL